MSAREIHCKKCRTYLGTIRDAILRKDMVCYCGKCVSDPVSEIFGDIFGRKKK